MANNIPQALAVFTNMCVCHSLLVAVSTYSRFSRVSIAWMLPPHVLVSRICQFQFVSLRFSFQSFGSALVGQKLSDSFGACRTRPLLVVLSMLVGDATKSNTIQCNTTAHDITQCSATHHNNRYHDAPQFNTTQPSKPHRSTTHHNTTQQSAT